MGPEVMASPYSMVVVQSDVGWLGGRQIGGRGLVLGGCIDCRIGAAKAKEWMQACMFANGSLGGCKSG